MARKDISMTPEELTEFLSSGAKILQVATIGKDGSPHLAPMWFVLDDGRIVFRSFTKSQKIVNLKRDPRITVLVEDRDYVLELYGRVGARYPFAGDTPVELDPDALEAAFGRFAEKNTAVVVEPEKVTSWDHKKLGGAY